MIGLEPTFDEHLSNLVDVFREVRRVLRDDGTLWLNYGDAYATGGGRILPSELGEQWRGKRQHPGRRTTPGGLKPKDLLMMPSRVAMALQAPHLRCRGCLHVAHESRWGRWPNGRRICPGCEKSRGTDVETPGWWLRSEIIWAKNNPMPESATDRPTNAHEKMFLLSKSARYFYDAEAVRVVNANPAPGAPATNYVSTTDGRRRVDPDRDSGLGKWRERNDGVPRNEYGANLRNVWTIATHSFKEAHFATFPPKLVEPCIKAGTSQRGVCGECGAPWKRMVRREKVPVQNGRNTRIYEREPEDGEGRDVRSLRQEFSYATETTGWEPTCEHNTATVPATVLDPFAGSGTVGQVALSLGRKFIGVEISAEYTDMAKRRVMGPLFAGIV